MSRSASPRRIGAKDRDQVLTRAPQLYDGNLVIAAILADRGSAFAVGCLVKAVRAGSRICWQSVDGFGPLVGHAPNLGK